MLISEQSLRKLIRRSLILEAKYKLSQLKANLNYKFPGYENLYDYINDQFMLHNPDYNLDNPKSPGRIFIDLLYDSLNELITSKDIENIDIKDHLQLICHHIVAFEKNRNITSRTVRSGENFKNFINNFLVNYNSIQYPGTTTLFSKIKFVHDRLIEKSQISGYEDIINNLSRIKKDETYYPFGSSVFENYIIVCPTSQRSSIFWARTNWLGEDIILSHQNDIEWCTARLKGGNLFNQFFITGGTNLFYFLPVNDVDGIEKFCIGITKKVDDSGKVNLSCGDYTFVGFENVPFFKKTFDYKDPEIKNLISNCVGVSTKILTELEKTMDSKEAYDPFATISLMDLDIFKSITNINSLAPIDPKTNKRNQENLNEISKQINNVLQMYANEKYTQKGYKINIEIVNYINNNLQFWENEKIKVDQAALTGLKFIAKELFNREEIKYILSNNPAYASFAINSPWINNDFELMDIAISKDHKALDYIGDELKNNKEFAMKTINQISNNASAFRYFSNKFKNDKEFIMKMIHFRPNIYKILNDELKNEKDIVLKCSPELSNVDSLLQSTKVINLQDLPDHFKDDKDVVMSYVAPENKSDDDLLYCAGQFAYVSNRLKEDVEFMKILVKRNSYIYNESIESIKSNKDVLLTAIKYQRKNNKSLLRHAPEFLKNDIDIVNAAIKKSKNNLKYLPEKYSNK